MSQSYQQKDFHSVCQPISSKLRIKYQYYSRDLDEKNAFQGSEKEIRQSKKKRQIGKILSEISKKFPISDVLETRMLNDYELFKTNSTHYDPFLAKANTNDSRNDAAKLFQTTSSNNNNPDPFQHIKYANKSFYGSGPGNRLITAKEGAIRNASTAVGAKRNQSLTAINRSGARNISQYQFISANKLSYFRNTKSKWNIKIEEDIQEVRSTKGNTNAAYNIMSVDNILPPTRQLNQKLRSMRAYTIRNAENIDNQYIQNIIDKQRDYKFRKTQEEQKRNLISIQTGLNESMNAAAFIFSEGADDMFDLNKDEFEKLGASPQAHQALQSNHSNKNNPILEVDQSKSINLKIGSPFDQSKLKSKQQHNSSMQVTKRSKPSDRGMLRKLVKFPKRLNGVKKEGFNLEKEMQYLAPSAIRQNAFEMQEQSKIQDSFGPSNEEFSNGVVDDDY